MNNIKSPQIAFVFDRRKIATPTIKASVEMRITYNYKQKFLPTGIKLYSNQWKNSKILNCPDITLISQTLDKMLSQVREIILSMMNEGFIDINSIPSRLSNLNQGELTFIEFCKQRAAIRKYGKEKDTQERYDRFIRLFNKWGRIQSFSDISEERIILYDEYLTSRGMQVYSRWNNYHRFLNSFIMDAIDAGYLKRNPYKWLNVERGKHTDGIGKYLSPDEFRLLKGSPMPTESLVRVRDVFVFQTYTCMSYTDMKNFNPKFIRK